MTDDALVAIASLAHKGLKRLYEEDDASKVDPMSAVKLRLILGFLEAMADPEELKARRSGRPINSPAIAGVCGA